MVLGYVGWEWERELEDENKKHSAELLTGAYDVGDCTVWLYWQASLHPIKEVILRGQRSVASSLIYFHRLHWTDKWINVVDTAAPHFHFNMSQIPNSLLTFLSLSLHDSLVSYAQLPDHKTSHNSFWWFLPLRINQHYYRVKKTINTNFGCEMDFYQC